MAPNDAYDTAAAGIASRVRIAQAVNARLQSAGIPQLAVSEQTGIPMTTFVRKITGKSPFDIDELGAIAALLDVSVAALITYAEHAEPVVA